MLRPGSTEAGGATWTRSLPLGVALREPPPSAGPGARLRARRIVELALLAERLGYHSVWIPEGRGWEAFALLGGMAGATERSALGTGIVPVFSRPPALAAMGLATLDDLSGGRLIFGVGAGHPEISERGYGVLFREPVTAVSEFVEIVRRAMGGETVRFSGRVFRVADFALESPPRRIVPIYVAALGSRMLKLAGEIGDGVLLNWIPAARAPVAVEAVRRAAAATGGRAAALQVACYVRVCITDRAGPAREALRRLIALYARFPAYRAMWRQSGFAEEMARGEAAGSETEAVVRAISDRMVDALGLIGDPAAVHRGLQGFRDAGVDLPIVYPFVAGPSEQAYRDTIEGLAPRQLGGEGR
ncbi:MAG: LLM class flavin-dependent oxidoreductase [Armatimonadota bacterium]|nr:LLM class flavin-dependent oxidoreductase [Armatimonadota bacterium]